MIFIKFDTNRSSHPIVPEKNMASNAYRANPQRV